MSFEVKGFSVFGKNFCYFCKVSLPNSNWSMFPIPIWLNYWICSRIVFRCLYSPVAYIFVGWRCKLIVAAGTCCSTSCGYDFIKRGFHACKESWHGVNRNFLKWTGFQSLLCWESNYTDVNEKLVDLVAKNNGIKSSQLWDCKSKSWLSDHVKLWIRKWLGFT